MNTLRQLGYALGIALFGTVLTSRMGDSPPEGAARALAGGGAGALRGAFGEETLRAAFADGLNAMAVAAGATAWWPGCWCSPLVRRPAVTKTSVTPAAPSTLTEETPVRRGCHDRQRPYPVIGSYRFGGDYGPETYSTVSFLSDPSPCERIFLR
ncbi:hypothetical protein [Streptomyces sp. bgisy034]|uniref:hypothetical protein n=1 Tax=Streptomyces sp. bgisy034 TaxID=3413774 RepID=UPI003EBAF726